MPDLYFYKCHQKWLQRIGLENIKQLEHFRVPYENNTSPPNHIAVVVDKEGRCYIGIAVCSNKDQYIKKRGYAISVGRALATAATRRTLKSRADFTVDIGATNRELRDLVWYALQRHFHEWDFGRGRLRSSP